MRSVTGIEVKHNRRCGADCVQSPGTRAALVKYAKQRDKLCLRPRSEAFLVSERGQRLQGCTARRTFARISCAVGVRPATGTGAAVGGPGFRIFATVSLRGS